MTTTEDVKGTAFQRDTPHYSQGSGRTATGEWESHESLVFELREHSWDMQGICVALRMVLDDVEYKVEAMTRDHLSAIYSLSAVLTRMNQYNNTVIRDLNMGHYGKE